MPFLLRKIRKSKWYANQIPWLSENELQADALTDLGTKNNTLSVWYVEDDKSNLERIISALAANRDNVSNFDYALFDFNSEEIINMKIISSSGDSPDELVNSNWHYELTELSTNQILNLASLIAHKGEMKRITEQQVKRLIGEAISHSFLDYGRIDDKIKNKIVGDSQ